MKKLILILFTFLMAHGFYSQGNNLQFSQVLNYDYSVQRVNAGFHNVGTLTVGSGKAWKITTGSAYYNENSSFYTNDSSIKVGGHIVFSNYSKSELNTPLWLSSGTYSVYLCCTNGSADNIYGAISIVEFNIVP